MPISKAMSTGNKPNELVSVVDYGAVGDGVTDDTAAIRDAFNALTEYSTLHIPPGNYLIDTANRVASGGIYYFPYMFTITVDHVAIKADKGAKFTVQATGGLHADLIAIAASNDIEIDGVTAVGVPYVMTDAGDAETTGGIYCGVSMYTTSNLDYSDIKITNNNFQYCLYGGVFQTGSTLTNGVYHNNTLRYIRGHGFTMYKAEGSRITNNYIYKQQTHRQNPYVSGSTFQGLGIDVSDYCNHVVVAHNTIDDCVFGIKTENDTTLASQDAAGNIITDNIISNVNLNEQYGSAASYYGIKVAAERSIAANNHIYNCYARGIVLNTGDSEQISVTGNLLVGCLDAAIRADASDNSAVNVIRDRTLISNNTIDGQITGETAPIGIISHAPYVTISSNKLKNTGVGIQAGSNGHNCIIAGNSLKECGNHAIFATSPDEATFDVHDLLIEGNALELDGSSGAGIYLTRTDYSSVISNRVISTTNSSTQRGIYISTNVTNDDGHYLISNNYVENWYRNIQVDNAKNCQIASNNIKGHGTSDRGINTASVVNGLIDGNFIDGCNEGITTLADNANLLVDSNNTSGCTTGLTTTLATTGTNV